MSSTEKKILDAAHFLFFHFGYKKTSIDEIAAKAGVGKGTIYNYFSNKEELFKKMGQNKMQTVKDQIEKDLAHITQADERILKRFKSEFNQFKAQRVESGTTQALMEELFEACQEIDGACNIQQDGFYQDLKLGVEQGIFKNCDFSKIAQTFHLILQQFAMKWLFMEASEMLKEQDLILNLMIDGIRV